MSQPMHTGSIKTSDCFTANLCGKESKMNHLGDTNKMVRDTPRMDASAHDDGAIWQTGCDIERELNAAKQRIKRLEDAGDKMEPWCSDWDAASNWEKAKEAKL